jgi:MarR family transcriptional regulator for hemolysin
VRSPTSSVVPLIDQLERSGLVERRVDSTDKRARLIHLTAAGTTLAAQVEARTAEIRQTLLACIEADELVIATRVLDQLHATMARIDEQG